MNYYTVIQFDENGGSGLAVVSNKWITPRKTEVFWPPYKDETHFNNALKRNEEVDPQKWQLYNIARKFYETDDLEQAKRKLKLAEDTSDLNQSEVEEGPEKRKRAISKPAHLNSESESDDDLPTSKFQRPKKIAFKKFKADEISQQSIADNADTRSNEHSSTASLSSIASSSQQLQLQEVLAAVLRLHEQNDQILNILRKKSQVSSELTTDLSALPSLPVKIYEDLLILESKLQDSEQFNALKLYFSSLGGHNLSQKVNRILRTTIAEELAAQFNFCGLKHGEHVKRAFTSLTLKKVIIDSLQLTSIQSTVKEIEDAIKVWLKHAPERLKKKAKAIHHRKGQVCE